MTEPSNPKTRAPHSENLSSILQEIFSSEASKTTIANLVKDLNQHGIAIVLILFSVPAALPIPAAGYSTLLSIPLFIIAGRLIAGRKTIWLPEKILQKSFNPAKFSGAIGRLVGLAKFLEKFSRPRLRWLTESKGALMGIGVIIVLLAASMALPIPGTNTAPAFAIFILGFGMLEKDGFAILAGALASIVALVISCSIIFFGYEIVKAFIRNIF